MISHKPSKRILVVTYGDEIHASSRIRAIAYIPYMEKDGFSITHLPRIPSMERKSIGQKIGFAFQKRWLLGQRLMNLLFGRYDLVFIQRVLLTRFEIKAIQLLKIRMVFDFDDAIFMGGNEERFTRMLQHAQSVMVSTNELAQYCHANHKEALVVTTPVEHVALKAYEQNKTQGVVRLGWLGSPHTAHYLEPILPVVERMARQFPIQLWLMGVNKRLGNKHDWIQIHTWGLEQEDEFLNSIDIGIMPLDDSEWSKYKGGYKLLKYMSYGKAVIASPVGINKEIVEDGVNGFLAHTPMRWEEAILKLINSVDLRTELGKNGYDKVQKYYTREVCYQKLRTVLIN